MTKLNKWLEHENDFVHTTTENVITDTADSHVLCKQVLYYLLFLAHYDAYPLMTKICHLLLLLSVSIFEPVAPKQPYYTIYENLITVCK